MEHEINRRLVIFIYNWIVFALYNPYYVRNSRFTYCIWWLKMSHNLFSDEMKEKLLGYNSAIWMSTSWLCAGLVFINEFAKSSVVPENFLFINDIILLSASFSISSGFMLTIFDIKQKFSIKLVVKKKVE